MIKSGANIFTLQRQWSIKTQLESINESKMNKTNKKNVLRFLRFCFFYPLKNIARFSALILTDPGLVPGDPSARVLVPPVKIPFGAMT